MDIDAVDALALPLLLFKHLTGHAHVDSSVGIGSDGNVGAAGAATAGGTPAVPSLRQLASAAFARGIASAPSEDLPGMVSDLRGFPADFLERILLEMPWPRLLAFWRTGHSVFVDAISSDCMDNAAQMEENKLRQLFARNPGHQSLSDPHVSLIDVFRDHGLFRLGHWGCGDFFDGAVSFRPPPPLTLVPQQTLDETHVGKRVSIYWPSDRKSYAGVLAMFDQESGKHTVCYDDGDTKEYDMSKRRFALEGEKEGESKRGRGGDGGGEEGGEGGGEGGGDGGGDGEQKANEGGTAGAAVGVTAGEEGRGITGDMSESNLAGRQRRLRHRRGGEEGEDEGVNTTKHLKLLLFPECNLPHPRDLGRTAGAAAAGGGGGGGGAGSGGMSVTGSLESFRLNFDEFTSCVLDGLDWGNVLAAGGACTACLLPLPQETQQRGGRAKNGGPTRGGRTAWVRYTAS
jgi:hypothetical protein